MAQVWNKRSAHPASAVYIGRGGPWGNPFVIGRDGDRAEVIRLYRNWIYRQPDLLRKVREELAGLDLLCFCAPEACHGDVLLKIATTASDADFMDMIAWAKAHSI